MQPFCQNPQLSRSLESELESAAKSGELKLQGKNLKDFPRLATDRYKLQDTTLAGLIIVFNWSITTDNHCHRHFRHNHRWLDRLQTCTENMMMWQCLEFKDLENLFHRLCLW